MLHTETVEGKTFSLLKTLMQDDHLSHFLLAGGTNLALRLGHRKSIDLDLFTPAPFEGKPIAEHLKVRYNFDPLFVRPQNGLQGTIDGIKVDFVAYIYPHVGEPTTEEEIRLYNIEDIVAMKLLAIRDNGTRLKDFVDIAYLSCSMPLNRMMQTFEQKFQTSSIGAWKSLTFFDDIRFEAEIVLPEKKVFDWKKIEQRILQMIKYETKVFETEPI
ncbi:hypothetical protein FACS189454_09900 [Planctomycetales bacterium]|nr:hypothetical protein FACS189454_09900 [Planctomycetales bacterium]